MRLERVFIDGFKNLNHLEVEFDTGRMTTVIIGQNGSGKSNLIEAITEVFRHFDLKLNPPQFRYKIIYRIGTHRVRLSNWVDIAPILVDDVSCNSAEFDRRKSELFPDLIFGYYSGGSQRLERLFDTHQRRYYDAIKRNDDLQECLDAWRDRRLFYCRPIHGIFALLSFFAFPDPKVATLLREKLGIVGFHSALAHFREPWFAKGSKAVKASKAVDLWGAEGPAGECARRLRDHAFHPFALVGSAVDDYRDKNQTEAQFAAFLRDGKALKAFASLYDGDQSMFNALEAADISDLFRDFHVWVTRKNDMSGDVSFGDLSDGERQLLMALGLIRISRGKQALFLLDEPDTHLNPHWQLSYLDLIKEWTGIAADTEACQIVMTSHNPLTISALEKEDVRILFQEEGKVSASRPYTDPRGMGFTATLTEIFGLPSSLDPVTQGMVDDRNMLVRVDQRSERQERKLIEINDKLNRLGFMFEERDPLYQDFLRAWNDVRYEGRPILSPQEIEARQRAMQNIIKRMLADKGGQA